MHALLFQTRFIVTISVLGGKQTQACCLDIFVFKLMIYHRFALLWWDQIVHLASNASLSNMVVPVNECLCTPCTAYFLIMLPWGVAEHMVLSPQINRNTTLLTLTQPFLHSNSCKCHMFLLIVLILCCKMTGNVA